MEKGLAIFFAAWMAACAAVRAETFTINPLQSILTLSGSVAGNPASQQPPSRVYDLLFRHNRRHAQRTEHPV